MATDWKVKVINYPESFGRREDYVNRRGIEKMGEIGRKMGRCLGKMCDEGGRE